MGLDAIFYFGVKKAPPPAFAPKENTEAVRARYFHLGHPDAPPAGAASFLYEPGNADDPRWEKVTIPYYDVEELGWSIEGEDLKTRQMQIGFRSIVSEDSPVQMGDTFTYESKESVWISYSGYTALARIPGLEVLQEYSNCDGSYSDTTLFTRTLAALKKHMPDAELAGFTKFPHAYAAMLERGLTSGSFIVSHR